MLVHKRVGALNHRNGTVCFWISWRSCALKVGNGFPSFLVGGKGLLQVATIVFVVRDARTTLNFSSQSFLMFSIVLDSDLQNSPYSSDLQELKSCSLWCCLWLAMAARCM